jgi:hypothetical protein
MPKARLAKSESPYGVHPGVAMVQKWLAELKEETRHSMEEWLALVKKATISEIHPGCFPFR